MNVVRKFILRSIPEIENMLYYSSDFYNTDAYIDPKIGNNVVCISPVHVTSSNIGDYTYIARNSVISFTKIGKFCSIGPNFVCGYGIHPTNGISTAPMFYSSKKQNGVTFSSKDKIIERKPILIGNDVFIGANVTVLDGVTIGDGAIIGAGAVVSKDIPPYAVAIGCPIVIKRYRMSESQIESMLRIKWWDWPQSKLKEIEEMFFDIEKFIKTYDV